MDFDFDPPSFSLGSDDFRSPAPDQEIPPVERIAVDCSYDVPDSEEEEGGLDREVFQRRRLKRLRRVVEEDSAARESDLCVRAGPAGPGVGLEDDDIEDFSEEEASTVGDGGCHRGASWRVREQAKTPLPRVSGALASTSSGVKRSDLSSRKRQGGSLDETDFGCGGGWRSGVSDGAPLAVSGGRACGDAGRQERGKSVSTSPCDFGWRMRQPDFDEGETSLGGGGAEWRTDGEVKERSDYADLEGEEVIFTHHNPCGNDVYPMMKGKSDVVELLRRRLPNFIPVDVLASEGGFEGEPVHIDYRNQFSSGPGAGNTPRRGGPIGQSQGGKPASRRGGGGQARGRGRGKIAAFPAPASTANKGYWTTEKAGNRIYVTQDGQKLSGRIAYKQHLRENGKPSKKRKSKSGRGRASKKS